MSRKQRRAEPRQDKPLPQRTSPSAHSLFADAVRHLQAGHLTEAERLFRQVLVVDPRHADSLHLLGAVACQTGRYEVAFELINRAIAASANVAFYHSNLGNIHQQLGRPDEAVACYQRAIDLQSNYPEAHSNLGHALRTLGRLDEAAACYRKAIDLKPDYPEAHHNLANTLKDLGQLDAAAECYRRAIHYRPNYAEAHCNLGNVLKDQRRLDDAVASYRTAIDLKPDFVEAHSNLGLALKEQAPDEAIGFCRRAVELKPDFPEAHYNLGTVLHEQGRLDEAVACYRRAIDLRPDYPEAHSNLGFVLTEQGLLDEAVVYCRRAICLRHDFADAHVNLALALLARGDMPAGWKEYEWRLQTPKTITTRRNFAQPQWRGDTAVGRTLLIHAEQGFGDTLQFCRYGPLAAARGLRVMMEVQKPLVRLLRCLPAVELVVARGDKLPPFDLHCPMLSMPLAMGTTMATIPSAASYLHADAAQVAAWRKRLAAPGAEGFSIGLAWTGNTAHAAHRRRSIAPDRLTPLFEQAGLRFFSLQKGGTPAPANLPLTDFMPEMGDFADTAALISNLDLVISVDTAVAHLAAALGKPVWLLDRFDSDFRWFTGRRDSPWYPTLRLYRQPRPGAGRLSWPRSSTTCTLGVRAEVPCAMRWCPDRAIIRRCQEDRFRTWPHEQPPAPG
jgi:tetratricopeptide (TPR) repeat protein